MSNNKIVIVTGNPGKVKEIEAMAMGKIDFIMKDLDLDEIQSLDLQAIVSDKAKKAFEIVKGPVIVDDVSAGLKSLGGLPGPFIKFFSKRLGGDSLYKISKVERDEVSISCIAAYYDGKNLILGEGLIKGRIVSPKGDNGFGFDSVVVPDGETRTMAEMSASEKMKISHRGKAFQSLLDQLNNLR